MYRVTTVALGALLAASVIGQAQAQSLRVSPVTIDRPAMSKTATISVGNEGNEPVSIQARVFRWTLKGGKDHLERTSDVVVSPPISNIPGGRGAVVRLVRVTDRPVEGEETYRVFIEELPGRRKLQAGQVGLLTRHSIPVFFSGFDARRSEVGWSAARRNNKLVLTATNQGDRRSKIEFLRVTDGAARQLADIRGLAGYVLGGQTKIWELPLPGGLQAGATLQIEANTEQGPIRAQAVVGRSG